MWKSASHRSTWRKSRSRLKRSSACWACCQTSTVTYIPNAVPLTSKQKFKLAWKTVIDPFTLVAVAGAAGVEQAQDHFAEYGQGAQGYAKRFGAGYADTASGVFIGAALLPSLLKQDPRYFYKGTGSTRSRALYAIANSFVCKGDNGRWQTNYSNILGSLAAGGISNLYYPRQDRNGLGLTFENAGLGLARLRSRISSRNSSSGS